jgi:HK97 family phage prohead protease
VPDITSRGERPSGPEVRTYPAKFEVRALPGGSLVELQGYASTTEQPYEMYDMFGSYDEVVRRGAFGKTLAEGADVSFLVNHGGLTMARTKAETLRLEEDSTGLLTVATLNTKRSDVRDLTTSVEDGNTDEMSFAFRVTRQDWSPDYTMRSIVEVDLNRGDVSAVNYGANPNTSIGAQRAFRSAKPAELHRMALEAREGNLSDASMQKLAAVLEQLAAVEDLKPADEQVVVEEPTDDTEQREAAAAFAVALQLRHAEDLRRFGRTA